MKSSRKNKLAYLYVVATVALLLSAALGVLLGPSDVSLSSMLSALINGNTDTPEARIFLYVRLPRVLATLICGMALATSGAVIQGVLANKLASPSVIGVNAGAGLAVTLCSAIGVFGGWRLSLFAFLGAFITVAIVSLAAKKWGASRGTVILIGVAVNALLGAISDTVTVFSPDISVQSLDFKIGDFSSVTYPVVLPAAAVTLASLIILQTLTNELDVLTLGDERAAGLGLNIGVVRMLLLALAALLSGAAVSVCGLLSFVGLLVPHAVRRIATSQAKHLVPLCALFGASFVTVCDTAARVIFAPYELPVGIIMAFLGAPFFIFILIGRKGGHRS